VAPHDEAIGLLERLPAGQRMTRNGIRYPNMLPDQETRAEPRRVWTKARPGGQNLTERTFRF
jgi:hypothetical protein